jgi:ribosomal protein RSM22 (predicted rRNA methylase)
VLHLYDRSDLALRFASRRAATRYPALTVNTGPVDAPALMLISHVLTELTPEQRTQLEQLALNAQAVIWVEPGAFAVSQALIAIRQRLAPRMNVVAPCPHQVACGLLAAGNERHWCHHFASPPPEIFTDGDWARFARFMGIDLRSLPVSYLVLDRRPPPVLPQGAMRVLGRPRVYKAHALLLGCQESGVREHRLEKRVQPEVFKELKKGRFESLLEWNSHPGATHAKAGT